MSAAAAELAEVHRVVWSEPDDRGRRHKRIEVEKRGNRYAWEACHEEGCENVPLLVHGALAWVNGTAFCADHHPRRCTAWAPSAAPGQGGKVGRRCRTTSRPGSNPPRCWRHPLEAEHG